MTQFTIMRVSKVFDVHSGLDGLGYPDCAAEAGDLSVRRLGPAECQYVFADSTTNPFANRPSRDDISLPLVRLLKVRLNYWSCGPR